MLKQILVDQLRKEEESQKNCIRIVKKKRWRKERRGELSIQHTGVMMKMSIRGC